jgi:hypothetical protein
VNAFDTASDERALQTPNWSQPGTDISVSWLTHLRVPFERLRLNLRRRIGSNGHSEALSCRLLKEANER